MKIMPLLVATIVTINTLTSSAWNSVNNNTSVSDYKELNYETSIAETKKITGSTDKDESINNEINKYTVDLGRELSYLIQEDVISRKFKYNVHTGEGEQYDIESSTAFNKSDLIVSLHRSYFDIIESDHLRFNVTSIRDGNYLNGIIKDFYGIVTTEPDDQGIVNEIHYNGDFSKGDYWIYTAPDVYELYFYDALQRGILYTDEFSGSYGENFIDDVDAYGEGVVPSWFPTNKQFTSSSTNKLGYSYKYNATTIDRNNPKYFEEEKITTLDALKIIENYMRTNEREMTKLEADIVAYKYSINYLNILGDSDKDTIEYLIAMGILNFENPDEFINFYGTLTSDIAIKLLYRVANNKARFNFSSIVLTDSQSYWKEKGFIEDVISIDSVTEVPSALEPQEITEDSDTLEYRIGQIFKAPRAKAATKKITIERVYSSSINYYYNGKTIASLYSNNTEPDTIASIEKGSYIVNGVDQQGYKVKYSITSRSTAAAIAYLETAITYDVNANRKYIKGVTSVDNNGEYITLIPKSVIEQSWTDIRVVKDKMLENTKTGVTAIILPDAGYALIGGQVIVSSVLMSELVGGEIYYNIDILSNLLSNTVMRKLTSGLSMYEVPLLPEYNYTVMEDSVKQSYMKAIKLTDPNDANDFKMLFNMSDFSNYKNIIYRHFDLDGKRVTVVVEYNYVFPDSRSFYTSSDKVYDLFTNKSLTPQDITDALYVRPSNSILQEWWDSNIGLGNALANFIYGTENVKYIASGYMAPSLYVFGIDPANEDEIQSLFDTYKFKLYLESGADYGRYVKYTTHKFWKSYYKESNHSSSVLTTLHENNRTFVASSLDTLKDTAGKEIGGYGSGVVILNTGAVYKQIDLQTKGNEPIIKVDNAKKTVTMTSIKSQQLNLIRGDEVYVNEDYSLIYIGITQDSQMMFLPNFEIEEDKWLSGYPSLYYLTTTNSVRAGIGTAPMRTANGMVTDDLTLNRLPKIVYESNIFKYDNKSALNKFYSSLGNNNPVINSSLADTYGIHNRMGILKEGHYYLHNGTVAKFVNNTVAILSDRSVIDNVVINSTVTAIPYIYLPTGHFTVIANDGTSSAPSSAEHLLGIGFTENALSLANPLSLTVGESVISKIIDKELGVVPLKDIPFGSSVEIAGYQFIRKDGYLEALITNTSLIKDVKKHIGNEAKVSRVIKNLFSGHTVYTDKYITSLQTFITEYKVGNSVSSSKSTLYRKGNVYAIRSDGKDIKIDKKAEAVSIRISLSEQLSFRQISSDNTKYALSKYVPITTLTEMEDLPFFIEDLDYDIGISEVYNTSSSEYTSSIDAELAKPQYDKEYKKEWFETLKSVVGGVLMTLCFILSVTCWGAKIIQEVPMYRTVFEAIAFKDSKGKKGIDLVSVLTVGIFNLDRDASYFKTILVSLISFCIGFITYNYIHQ